MRPRISSSPRQSERTAPGFPDRSSCLITPLVANICSRPDKSLSLEATLTASPKQSPACSTTSPLAIPIWSPIFSGSGQSTIRCWCTRCISITAPRAFALSINTTRTPSPRYLTTRPPWAVQTFPIHWVRLVMARVALVFPKDSKSPVLPVRSAKTTVTSVM